MANQFGGLGILFANLTQQLTNYRELGPPQIPRRLMSEKEILFARQHYDFGIEGLKNIVDEFENNVQENEEEK